jgi:hypothetical protein
MKSKNGKKYKNGMIYKEVGRQMVRYTVLIRR